MSSLRDQLVTKGLATTKDKRRVEREAKEQRKKNQGARRRARDLERERQEAERLAAEARLQARLELRNARQAERAAIEHRLRVQQIIRSNQLRSRGRIPYWHRAYGSSTLPLMRLSEAVAFKLRAGELAIAAEDQPDGAVEYRVVNIRAAEKLEALGEGARLVVWVRDTQGISAPEEQFLEADWEVSLVPHRVR